jgi:hypothetical protein
VVNWTGRGKRNENEKIIARSVGRVDTVIEGAGKTDYQDGKSEEGEEWKRVQWEERIMGGGRGRSSQNGMKQ